MRSAIVNGANTVPVFQTISKVLQTYSPDSRYHLSLYLLPLHCAEVTAVHGSISLVCEYEVLTVLQRNRIFYVLLIWLGVIEDAGLRDPAAPDADSSVIPDYQSISRHAYKAADILFAVPFHDHDIISRRLFLQAIVNQHIAGGKARLHIIPLHRCQTEYDAEQHSDHNNKYSELLER